MTFTTTFTSPPAVSVTQIRGSADVVSATVTIDTSGFDVWLAFPLTSGITTAGVRSICWMAIGE